MKKIIFSLLLGISFIAPVHSEIQQITIRWVPLRCQETCTKLLNNEFKKIKGVDEIFIDQASGQATITWKEKVPFQFTSINTAMHMVGLSMRDIRIKVKGPVKHSGNVFYITSEGDNTRFDLMNPVTVIPYGQSPEFNAQARELSPGLKKQFMDAESLKQIATIEGPVFMPERMTVPTQIVVDHLSFEDANAGKK